MKQLTLTDDEYKALGEILLWFQNHYPVAGLRRTYARIIAHHMKEGEKNEGNEESSQEPR